MNTLRPWLQIVRYATGIILLLGLAWYLWQRPEEVLRLTEISVPVLAAVFVARLASYAMLVISTWRFIKIFAPALNLWEYFLVSSSGFALGMFSLPGSSYVVKTVYLKQRHGFSHVDFLAVNILVGLFTLLTAGVIACGSLTLIRHGGDTVHIGLWALAIGLAIGASSGLVLIDKSFYRAGVERTIRLAQTYRKIVCDHEGIRLVFISLTLRTALSFLGFGLLFYALGGGTILAGGVMDSLSTLLRLVRFTPGNLGIYEWSVASLGHWLDASMSIGLIAAGLYRLIGLLAVAATTIFGLLIARVFRLSPVNNSTRP